MDQDHAGNRPLPDFPLLRFPFRLFFISSALVGAILIPSWLWVWTHGWLGLALEPVSHVTPETRSSGAWTLLHNTTFTFS